MTAKTKMFLAAASAALIIVLLLLMPKQPASKREAASVITSDPLHDKVDQAIAMVKGGEAPMQGIMLLREVLEEDSLNVPAHYWLGMFSIQSGQFDKAEERFEKVVSINPEYVDAYWQMAHLALERGNYYDAIENFNRVLELDPEEYSSAHFFLGKTYATVEEPKKAISSFRTYKKFVKDTVVSKRVDDFIDELESKN